MSGIGEAGARGPKIRSDSWVSVTLRETGGLEIDLRSKVASLYGRQIKEQMIAGCTALGVAHARVEIEDMGALPFVLAARLECAVLRARPQTDRQYLPRMREQTAGVDCRDRLRRSRLYLPGNQPKLMINAGLHGSDGLILDLEDAVHPTQKDAARILVRNALRTIDFAGAERMVRINQGVQGLQDLDWIIPHNVQVILVPKVEDPGTLIAVDTRINEILTRCGLPREIYLMPIIESALGAWRAFEIASASKRIVAVAIGLEDYTADIGCQRTREGHESFWARSQVINGAVAAGVQPIDTVFSDVDDSVGLKTSCLEGKALGFVGKGCVHPRQIAVVHAAFAPDEDAVAKAKDIVRAFEHAEAEGLGVVSLGSKMIDAPVVERARTMLRQAIAIGMIDETWREADQGECAS